MAWISVRCCAGNGNSRAHPGAAGRQSQPDQQVDPVPGGRHDQAEAEHHDTVSAVFDWYLHAMDRAVASFADYFTRPGLPGPLPPGLPRFASQADALLWCEQEYDNVVALIRYGAPAGRAR